MPARTDTDDECAGAGQQNLVPRKRSAASGSSGSGGVAAGTGAAAGGLAGVAAASGAELCGTMLLVLLLCAAGPAAAPVGALTAGTVIALLVQCFDHLSGAMFNPAVSLCGAILGRVSWRRAAVYTVAQVVGAAAGGVLAAAVTDCNACVTSLSAEAGVGALRGVAIEAVLTACLALANAAAWDARNNAGTDSWPLRIGTAVTALSLVGGSLSGASMNPARSVGPALCAARWEQHWVYWAGPLLGAACACLLYRAAWASAPPPAAAQGASPTPTPPTQPV